MALPTLLFLHMFMGLVLRTPLFTVLMSDSFFSSTGPVLWSAALCSGGVSLAHAALRDRDCLRYIIRAPHGQCSY